MRWVPWLFLECFGADIAVIIYVLVVYTVSIIIGVLRWILSFQLWILTHNALFIRTHLHFTPKTGIFFQEYCSLWKQNRTITSSSVRLYPLGKGCFYMSLCIMQFYTKRKITKRSYHKMCNISAPLFSSVLCNFKYCHMPLALGCQAYGHGSWKEEGIVVFPRFGWAP